jgi:hypothetical protein
MNKFTLYFLTDSNAFKMAYSGDELSYCLSYIRTNNLLPNRCMIISPNGRRITFTDNGSMMFGELPGDKRMTA